MMNEADIWNDEIVRLYEYIDKVNLLSPAGVSIDFYREDYSYGRAGLHQYFNDLYQKATGDWIIYFCEDHLIRYPHWDTYLLRQIEDRKLNPAQPWVLIPKFDNAGTMNHILSRGYCEAVGGSIGRHGWIDSYINEILVGLPRDRVIKNLDEELFHDFTHDLPNPMAEINTITDVSAKAKEFPVITAGTVKDMIVEDTAKINAVISGAGQ